MSSARPGGASGLTTVRSSAGALGKGSCNGIPRISTPNACQHRGNQHCRIARKVWRQQIHKRAGGQQAHKRPSAACSIRAPWQHRRHCCAPGLSCLGSRAHQDPSLLNLWARTRGGQSPILVGGHCLFITVLGYPGAYTCTQPVPPVVPSRGATQAASVWQQAWRMPAAVDSTSH